MQNPSSTKPTGCIQNAFFTTDDFAPGERWEAWRNSISVIFDVRIPEESSACPPRARVDAYNLGPVVFGDAHFSPQLYGRDSTKIRRDGMDHFLAQLYVEGGFAGSLERRPIEVRPGDICLFDLAQPLHTRCQDSRAQSLVIHRDLLESVLPGAAALHGSVLRRETGLCMLLTDHFMSLSGRLAHLSSTEGPAVADATVGLLAACLRPCARLAERARGPIDCASMNRVRRYIEANLQSPDLDPGSLCKVMGVSRAALFRLFEPLGGVASYIRSRRLAQAYAALTLPSKRHLSVREIALDWGFVSEAHFCRLFRRTFERTPGEARALADVRPLDVAQAGIGRGLQACGAGYSDWVRALSLTPACVDP